jgi:hypothetical protein
MKNSTKRKVLLGRIHDFLGAVQERGDVGMSDARVFSEEILQGAQLEPVKPNCSISGPYFLMNKSGGIGVTRRSDGVVVVTVAYGSEDYTLEFSPADVKWLRETLEKVGY